MTRALTRLAGWSEKVTDSEQKAVFLRYLNAAREGLLGSSKDCPTTTFVGR